MFELWLSSTAKIFGVMCLFFCFGALWVRVIQQVIYVEKRKGGKKDEK